MKTPRRIPQATRDKIIAHVNSLSADQPFGEKLAAAFVAAGLKAPGLLQRFPSSWPWLGVPKNFTHRKPKGTAKRPAPARKPEGHLVDAPDNFTLDEAVELLAAVISRRVAARIEARLDSIIAAKIAASASRLAATVPDSGFRTADSGLNSLDDDMLRIKAGVAKVHGDILLWGQCTAVLRRRERAASAITDGPKEREA